MKRISLLTILFFSTLFLANTCLKAIVGCEIFEKKGKKIVLLSDIHTPESKMSNKHHVELIIKIMKLRKTISPITVLVEIEPQMIRLAATDSYKKGSLAVTVEPFIPYIQKKITFPDIQFIPSDL